MSDAASETAVPHDMDGLRQLYFTEFCPLYNYLCSKLESIPSELHFEVSAAFDHLMRAGLEVDGRKYKDKWRCLLEQVAAAVFPFRFWANDAQSARAT